LGGSGSHIVWAPGPSRLAQAAQPGKAGCATAAHFRGGTSRLNPKIQMSHSLGAIAPKLCDISHQHQPCELTRDGLTGAVLPYPPVLTRVARACFRARTAFSSDVRLKSWSIKPM